MKIRIALWGQLKAAAGTDALEIEVESPCTPQTVLVALAQAAPALKGMLMTEDGQARQSTLAFVRGEQIAWDEDGRLPDGTEVTLMSPIAGG